MLHADFLFVILFNNEDEANMFTQVTYSTQFTCEGIVTLKPEEMTITRQWHSKREMTSLNEEPLVYSGG
jgi:hypothetical protein